MDCVGVRRNIWLGHDRCKLLARLQISLSLVTVALSLLPISEDSEVLCERHSAFCYRIRRAELWFTTTSSIWAAGVALCICLGLSRRHGEAQRPWFSTAFDLQLVIAPVSTVCFVLFMWKAWVANGVKACDTIPQEIMAQIGGRITLEEEGESLQFVQDVVQDVVQSVQSVAIGAIGANESLAGAVGLGGDAALRGVAEPIEQQQLEGDANDIWRHGCLTPARLAAVYLGLGALMLFQAWFAAWVACVLRSVRSRVETDIASARMKCRADSLSPRSGGTPRGNKLSFTDIDDIDDDPRGKGGKRAAGESAYLSYCEA